MHAPPKTRKRKDKTVPAKPFNGGYCGLCHHEHETMICPDYLDSEGEEVIEHESHNNYCPSRTTNYSHGNSSSTSANNIIGHVVPSLTSGSKTFRGFDYETNKR